MLAEGSGGGGEDGCRMRDRVEDGRQCFRGCLHAGDEISGAGQGLPEQFFGVRVVCRCAGEQRHCLQRLPGVQAGQARRARSGETSVRAGCAVRRGGRLQGADPAVSPRIRRVQDPEPLADLHGRGHRTGANIGRCAWSDGRHAEISTPQAEHACCVNRPVDQNRAHHPP